MNFFKKNCLIILVLSFSALFLSINLDKPFIGHHDWNGAFWGDVTRRYLTFTGLADSHYSEDPALTIKSLFYSNYTPFLPLVFTAFSALFGLSELTLRLSTVLFSLALVYFIYKIGEFLFNKEVGILASIFATVTPMYIYFGKMPDHEPIVTALTTIAFFFFLKTQKSNPSYNFLFLLFLTLGLLESWAAFFLIPPILLFSYFIKKQKIKKIYFVLLIPLVVVAVHLSVLGLTGGNHSILRFIQFGLTRANSGPNLIGGFSNYNILSFVITEAHYSVIYFTRILIVLSCLWVLTVIYKTKKKTVSSRELSLLILLVYPLSFVTVFRQLAFIHDYKLYHFLPFLSLSAAVFLHTALDKSGTLLPKKPKVLVSLSTVKIVFCVIITAAIFIERFNYLSTLLKSSFNTPGYELGMLIKDKTLPRDKVLVNSRQFGSFFGVFVNYYSDRSVHYDDIILTDFKKKVENYGGYKYFILIDGRDVDPAFVSYMNKNFSVKKYGPYNFFSYTNEI